MKEFDDHLVPGEAFCSISPLRVRGISGGDFLRIASVPQVLGDLHFARNQLQISKRRGDDSAHSFSFEWI
jgi:hypothetical protein